MTQLVQEPIMRFFPARFTINCPCTKTQINHLECYFCRASCPHRDFAASNLFFSAKRSPDKYPDWLYKQLPFSKIRRDGR